MKCYAYLLLCGDGSYYAGWTKNLQARVAAHQAGRGAKYTRSHAPVTLAYFEEFDNQHDAMRREYQLKHLSHQEKQLLCQTKSGRKPRIAPSGR